MAKRRYVVRRRRSATAAVREEARVFRRESVGT